MLQNIPMQQLNIVERLFPLILSGEKTSTIRFEEQSIIPGAMKYICNEEQTREVIVWVHNISIMPLNKVTRYLNQIEQWPDECLLAGMREHYPHIELFDIVQVIEHYSPAKSIPYLEGSSD